MFGMMNGDRYGGLKHERGCVLLNEGEEKKKIFFSYFEDKKKLFFFFLDVVGLVSGQRLQKNFAFSHHIWTNTYKTN